MCNGRASVCVDKNKGSERMSGSEPDHLLVDIVLSKYWQVMKKVVQQQYCVSIII